MCPNYESYDKTMNSQNIQPAQWKCANAGGWFRKKQPELVEKVVSFRASDHTGVGIPSIEGDCHTSDIGHWFAMTFFIILLFPPGIPPWE